MPRTRAPAPSAAEVTAAKKVLEKHGFIPGVTKTKDDRRRPHPHRDAIKAACNCLKADGSLHTFADEMKKKAAAKATAAR